MEKETFHVLLADDDRELVAMLKDYLEQDGFAVDTVHHGQAALDATLSKVFDIVVLDVMMPGISGIQALTGIRAQRNLPVVMLTARGDDTDRIVGLELGADDYVAKPCTPRELAARLRAILKRTGRASSPAILTTDDHPRELGDLMIHPAKRRITLASAPVELTGTEFSLMEVLSRYPGQPVSKQTLSQEGLGRPLTRFDRSVDVHMCKIRQKLGTLPDGRPRIETIIRKGYQLIVSGT